MPDSFPLFPQFCQPGRSRAASYHAEARVALQSGWGLVQTSPRRWRVVHVDGLATLHGLPGTGITLYEFRSQPLSMPDARRRLEQLRREDGKHA